MIKIQKQDLLKRFGVDNWYQTELGNALSRLPALTPEGPWIAGGAVRRTFAGSALNSDYDFFFRNAKQLHNFSKEIDGIGGIHIGGNDKNTAYTLPAVRNDNIKIEGQPAYYPQMDIQLINFQYYKSAEEVIDSFDFTITQFAFDGEHFYMSEFALWDLARKKLVINKVTYGAATIRRILKYSGQGFTLCDGAAAELLQQVAEHPEVIEADVRYID